MSRFIISCEYSVFPANWKEFRTISIFLTLHTKFLELKGAVCRLFWLLIVGVGLRSTVSKLCCMSVSTFAAGGSASKFGSVGKLPTSSLSSSSSDDLFGSNGLWSMSMVYLHGWWNRLPKFHHFLTASICSQSLLVAFLINFYNTEGNITLRRGEYKFANPCKIKIKVIPTPSYAEKKWKGSSKSFYH